MIIWNPETPIGLYCLQQMPRDDPNQQSLMILHLKGWQNSQVSVLTAIYAFSLCYIPFMILFAGKQIVNFAQWAYGYGLSVKK